ncbi:N-acetylmuramoyl-L-alanine amidase [Emticicia agri]|uniref:N-acetylmuramoyl-L-alanine amidase n=1 Tax=Emticicia agri TaxID=2492393 RepID=A0A4Q5LVB4_9BACT|nr:N-acetylmuramoyl-L-alanine amidase [Emticicia agri]RYU93584.1 N-acetylmuramoyl-L-alanine amidase [Emticicia agri]
MLFLTAGHHKKDAGATYNGRKEADETVRLRNAIARLLTDKGLKVWTDADDWDLNRTINEITKRSKPDDIICDLHFNAGAATASGCEVFVADNANAAELNLATELVNTIASTLLIRNRGVKKEHDSQHKRLGMMRPAGRNVLIEICFLSNNYDRQQYDTFFGLLAEGIARVLAQKIE